MYFLFIFFRIWIKEDRLNGHEFFCFNINIFLRLQHILPFIFREEEKGSFFLVIKSCLLELHSFVNKRQELNVFVKLCILKIDPAIE